MPLHLGEDRPLHEVDRAEAAFSATDDRDRRGRVHGEAVDAAFEAEAGVGAREFVDGLARAGVPQDQGRVLRSRDDLLACESSGV